MKKQRLKAVAMSTVLSATALMASVAQADQTLDATLKVAQSKTAIAQSSQKRIDKLAEETGDLLQEFKRVNKEIEGLRVYNAQLDKQIANQLVVIGELETSIENVTIIERQIQPLILRMVEGLEQFVALDVPFQLDERKNRIAMIRENMDRTEISVAEKFRQVLEAYKIESEYSRGIEFYEDTLEISGQERAVNMLQVGRIALVYQTKDTKMTGAWDADQSTWVELDSAEYRAGVLKAIRIAKKQASIEILNLPILAPEVAQ